MSLVIANVDEHVLTYPEMSTVADRDKSWLQLLVDAFHQRAQVYTGRQFESKQRTMTFSPQEGDQIIRLPAFDDLSASPDGSISTVHESTDQDWVAANLTSSDDYRYNSRTGALVKPYGQWQHGWDCVRVVWTDGWVDAPADLRMVCVLQVVYWYQNRSKIGTKQVSFQQGGSASTHAQAELLPEVREVLDTYRVEYA